MLFNNNNKKYTWYFGKYIQECGLGDSICFSQWKKMKLASSFLGCRKMFDGWLGWVLKVLLLSMGWMSLGFIPENVGWESGCCMLYLMVTHIPPTSEVGGSNPWPYEGKSVVANRWSAVYSTEPWQKLYVLVTSAHKTTHHDMTCAASKTMLKPK